MNRITRAGVALAALALLAGAARATETADTISQTREAMDKWVETERLISLEERDLALSKQMLNERIDLVKSEIKAMQQKIDDADKNIDEADEKRGELLRENDQLKAAAASMIETLRPLEARTRRLVARLPDPLRENIRPLSQRLPEGDGATSGSAKLTVAERFQNVIGILNMVDKFNQNMTVTSELRDLPDGTSAQVTALYLGLGQSYFVDAKGKRAALGRPAAEGWKWTEDDAAAPRVAQTIAIIQNEQVATFVPLPVKVQEPEND